MTAGCVFHGEDCRGRVQSHHCVPRQRIRGMWKEVKAQERRSGLKAWSITKAIEDERNLVGLCVFHHGQVEAKKLYVTPSDECREFAREYGLEWSLEADERRVA